MQRGAIPRRPYGRGKIPLSVIGLGGIVVMNADQNRANRVVAEAVERGVNYFDVAPSYGDAEAKLGPALRPYRKDAFLACKTTQRTRAAAEAEIVKSSERLLTDHFDLYQLHGLQDVAKDVDVAFGPGGVMEVVTEARRAGRIRHVGFSAHTEAAALAAMDRYDFDSVLFPVNFACWTRGNFGPAVVERARKQGMSVLALKALACQKWPADDLQRKVYGKCWYQPVTDRADAALALRFTLGQGVTAALPPGEEALFRLALDLAADIRPLTADEMDHLRKLAGSLVPVFAAST